jgi:hypothetical protein
VLLVEAVTACLCNGDASPVFIYSVPSGMAGQIRLVSESSNRSKDDPTSQRPRVNTRALTLLRARSDELAAALV